MEFVEKAEIVTDDFFYDLFDGGYIKPEKLLKNQEDIEKVQEAVKVLRDFRDSAEDDNIIQYL